MIRLVPLRRGFALLALAAGLSAAPAGCSKPSPPSDAAAPIDLSPVPAPAGLLAEVFLPTPDATWAKARLTASGPALFLPTTAAALIANLLGLPPTVAAEIDGGVPALGAMVDADATAPAAARTGASGRPRAALGIHVRAGDRFVDQLTRGQEARFQARVDAATSITLLEPKGAARPAPGSSAGLDPAPPEAPAEPLAAAGGARAAMGVLGNYLIVGLEVGDVLAVGPYVARTMPKAAVPKEDVAVEVPQAAIAGPILATARGGWERLREVAGAGVAPEALALAPMVEGWLEILGDLERARLTLSLDEAAHLRIAGTPRPGGGAASRAVAEAAVGDAAPLLELPADALLGLMIRETKASRGGGVARQADAVARLLGKEVPPKEREQMVASLRAISEARGDWFAAGLRFDSTGPTAYARLAVADEEKLAGALEGLVGLAKAPAIKKLLAEEALNITAGKTVIERLPGDVRRVRFQRLDDEAKGDAGKPPPPDAGAISPLPRTIDLLYLLQGGALFASAGYDPQEGLRRAIAAPGGESLGGVPAFRAALGALGGDTSLALIVDPLRLVASRAGRPGAAEPAPVVIAAGATPAPAALWLRADVAATAIREFVRYRGAL